MSSQTHSQNKPLKNDNIASVDSPISPKPSSIPMGDFKPVLDARFDTLKSLKGILSLRFYERIDEKLKQEELTAMELSGAASDQQKRQRRYSHVLDPQYFEQRFL